VSAKRALLLSLLIAALAAGGGLSACGRSTAATAQSTPTPGVILIAAGLQAGGNEFRRKPPGQLGAEASPYLQIHVFAKGRGDSRSSG